MINSEELIGTTQYLTHYTRCRINRCRYNRVRLYINFGFSVQQHTKFSAVVLQSLCLLKPVFYHLVSCFNLNPSLFMRLLVCGLKWQQEVFRNHAGVTGRQFERGEKHSADVFE